MNQHLYFLSVKTKNIVSHIGVNGADLVTDRDGRGIRTEKPVTVWLSPRRNQINVRLEEFEQAPFSEERPERQPIVELKFYLADPTKEYPKPGELIWEFTWSKDADSEDLPFEQAFDVAVNHPPPTRLWSEADRITDLDPQDRQSLLGLVEDFRQALLANQFNKAFDLVAYRYGEEALAEGKTTARLKDVVLEQYGVLGRFQPFESTSLEASKAQFKILGDQRLVQITDEQLRPAIWLEAPNHDFIAKIPVFAARINDQWVIAR